MKVGKFKTRITGSRSFTVLPNGLLVDLKTRDKLKCPGDIKADQAAKTAKGNREKRAAAEKLLPVSLADQLAGSLNDRHEKEPRRYYVKGKEVFARVYSLVNAQKNPLLHMVTVSFPPMVSDDQGYKYLNQWLTVCRQSLHLREYLYVAERQEIGTVHFHLMIPQFLNIVKANRAMMVILKNEVQKKNLDWSVFAAKKYNGVDIAKERIKNPVTGKWITTGKVTNYADPKLRKKLISYITKYVSKGERPKDPSIVHEGFKHLAWHNSRGFSAMFTGISLLKEEIKFLGLGRHANHDKKFTREIWSEKEKKFIPQFHWWPWQGDLIPKFISEMLKLVNQQILYAKEGTISKKLFYGYKTSMDD